VTVFAAVKTDLDRWQIADSADGQRALVLAAALDDRAGVQNIAATDKRLGELLEVLRDKHEPKTGGRLAVLRGGAQQTG
jgi:hypothetical protein